MGPFMVEIVFCRVTRRGRKLRKGMNKAGRANMRNDGPSMSFIPPEDTVKVTLDLSEGGPVFSAMDEMMMKMLDDDAKDRKKRMKEEYQRKRLGKTDLVDELKKEMNDAPEEVYMGGVAKKGKTSRFEDALEREEMDAFRRFNMTTKEKKALRNRNLEEM